ncbi:hypothetical protein BG011_001599 [Mortierella polycephala]|uniref:AB hydrolase-1 domain-containing protein n=1 Tax=Mortierella polycephala TaxID=41804 RepID=A0A9P6Q9G4_9FUNG|nr:hypothetical protein BG011_001599 [Mortierella polycephala]
MTPALHVDPASFNHKFVDSCGFKYHYVEEGDPKGEPLLLIHGFPDLWYGWRFQIKYLASLGYRVIAIDCLGYGQTDSPEDLYKYGMKSVCAQLVGILDTLNIPRITVIGHDWGGALVWRFGLYYPNRVHEIVKLVPEFEYQLGFANPKSTAEMDANVDGVLGNVLGMGKIHDKDLEYMVNQYKHSGFQGPLNYYRTTKINFEDERGLRKDIERPCWIILAKDDPFLKPHMARKMKTYMPQLKSTMIEAGHFVMVEKPDETNSVLKQCLEDLVVRRGRASL